MQAVFRYVASTLELMEWALNRLTALGGAFLTTSTPATLYSPIPPSVTRLPV